MKIEIIAIGNEILSGKTINTNGSYISKKLFLSGYKASYMSVYPDEKKEMEKGFSIALDRSDIIFITGGLGPTIDDITKNVLCNFLGIDLLVDEKIKMDIIKRFGKEAFVKDLAYVPKEAKIFKNEIGTAVGFAINYNGKHLFVLPGVPDELECMFENYALKYFLERFSNGQKVFQKIINTFLIPEVQVDNFLQKYKNIDDVEIGIYPSYSTVTVTLRSEKNENLEKIQKEFIKNFHKNIFQSENCLIEEALHRVLIEKNLKIAFAESITGGAISKKITSLPGSSKYFFGSFICYSEIYKKNILKVSEKTLKDFGAVSLEVAKEMLNNTFKMTNVDFALAISGYAGPLSERNIPVGTICVALGEKNGIMDAKIFHLQGNRKHIIEASSSLALALLYEKINSTK